MKRGFQGIERETTRLAGELMARAAALETPRERHDRARLARIVGHPEGIAFLARMLDRAARVREPRRFVGTVGKLVRARPRVLGGVEDALLDAWSALAPIAPPLAVPPFLAGLRREIGRYLVPGERAPLERYVARRAAERVKVNMSLVGEAVLSKRESGELLARCEAALGEPFVEAISVKISAIVPRTHPLALETLLPQATDAVARLFRAAGTAKLVSLDMEAFADLELTVAAFRAALDRPELRGATHGLALQAYVPESFAAQRDLTAWAAARVAGGGAPIRIRLVKGANLAAERFESRVRGTPMPTFPSKAATDAELKRMLAFALEPERAAAVRVGVASHNVFDVALALTLARERGTLAALTIEMLHGMAEPLLRAVAEVAPGVLVYAPAARRGELLAAVAYLLRRFDENAAPEHFLRHSFTMKVGDPEWQGEESRFRSAFVAAFATPGGGTEAPALRAAAAANPTSHATAKHIAPLDPPPTTPSLVAPGAPSPGEPNPAENKATPDTPFRNEPETDWTRPPNRTAARASLDRFTHSPPPKPARVTPAEVALAADAAARDASGWSRHSHAERRAVLLAAAGELRRRRFDLMAALAHDAGKTLPEADPEVCEAIDYAAYYARSLDALVADPALEVTPRGVIAVISPWNFPLAIPLGGVLSSLIGGNRVLLKPSPHAERIAWLGAEALWAAGVPRDALAVLPCDDAAAASLVADPRLDGLVFTGSTATARRLAEARPELRLFAESGGKNAVIVTATADRDRAIADIVRNSFGHAGQKCSAASLVVAEAEVYDDPAFRERLVEAARTLRLGPATDPSTELAPLVVEPGPVLASLVRELPGGERWALEPRKIGERHFTPGIVWDVREGSPTHVKEVFGPLVGVMRARDLADAIRLVNASGYGLTSALESLDEDEWRTWIDAIHAGNLYINRPLVGAIVERQPFGGWGQSALGPGAKTGGPNYAPQLVRIAARDPALPVADDDGSFAREVQHTQRIPGQLNLFRHRPAPRVVIRVEPSDDPAVVEARRAAARAAGADAELSTHEREPLERLIARLDRVTRVVMCRETAPKALLEAAARSWTWVCREPLTGTPRDLLPFLREQSISIDTQRHGWVAPGADDFGP